MAFEKADERRRFKASVARDKADRTYQAALATADGDMQQKQQTAAADFTGVRRGPAQNGDGGDAMWIHMADSRKVHVNGIGERRAKALIEWRQSYVQRAEQRAPRRITLADRQRIVEAARRRRAELEARKTAAEAVANEARTEAKSIFDAALARLTQADRAADRAATAQRSQYDAVAEELARLEGRLDALHARTVASDSAADRATASFSQPHRRPHAHRNPPFRPPTRENPSPE
ncbi:hypothetical protein OG211_14695 [Streptomyces niveus]|uniref:hypothetical protein n=1 Tax=Streptomyces niveus TaxID=193462 RepID=UPI00386EF1CD|nr:hypothetical protein OG211_14695 [Streptomyces niveus]